MSRVEMSKVTEYLQGRGVPFEVIPHTPAYTSVAEALAMGVPMGEVVKTLMVDTTMGRAIVVILGSRRMDMHLLHQAFEDHHAHLIAEEDLRLDYPDFELGCLPPIGSLLGVPAYVDPEVLAMPEIVFAASQTESVKVRTEDLLGREEVLVRPLHEVGLGEEEKELMGESKSPRR